MPTLTFAFVVSVITAAVTGVFAALVLRRWWQKRRPHLLAWGVGLLFYFLGTLSQVILSLTWNPYVFALWYWTGALMVAAWLGQGTVYLLWRRGNIARNIQMALLLVTVMTLPWALFFTPLDASAWYPGADMTQIYRDVMPQGSGTVRAFSPIMNTWGTVALVGGALYSARLFRRKQIMRSRMLGNWLIAAGGLLPAVAGALIRLGDPSFKYFGEMAGAVLIFAGFLLATSETAERHAAPTEAAVTAEASQTP
jgi:hypothetical protein